MMGNSDSRSLELQPQVISRTQPVHLQLTTGPSRTMVHTQILGTGQTQESWVSQTERSWYLFYFILFQIWKGGGHNINYIVVDIRCVFSGTFPGLDHWYMFILNTWWWSLVDYIIDNFSGPMHILYFFYLETLSKFKDWENILKMSSTQLLN